MPVSPLDRIIDARVNARAAGVARVVIGLAAAIKALVLAPVLARFADPDVLRVPYVEWLPAVTDLPAGLVLGAWLLVAGAFTIGLWTTMAGAALTIILGAVLLADQQLYSNHLYLLTLLVGLLTVARAGSAVSVDARRGGGRDTVRGWAPWLIRVQVSVVYLFAGLSKLNGTFISGTVVAVTLRSDGPLAIPAGWRTFEPMATVAILAILTELFLAVALWLPAWRRTAFVVGLGLHLAIALWFVPTAELVVFGLITLAPYLFFLPAPVHGAVVVWDDSCGFCRDWVTLFRRLDWLAALQFVPSSDARALAELDIPRSDADQALQLVAHGRREQGFRAVVGVLEHTPIAFLWAPLLRLPPIAWIGDRVYRRVAARRSCTLPTPGEDRP